MTPDAEFWVVTIGPQVAGIPDFNVAFYDNDDDSTGYFHEDGDENDDVPGGSSYAMVYMRFGPAVNTDTKHFMYAEDCGPSGPHP